MTAHQQVLHGPALSRRLQLPHLDVHYLDWPGEDPAIVLLHPNRTNARIWDFVVAASALPYRFLAPDHRGHGWSEWPAEGYSLQDYVDDDIAFLETLNSSPVVLVGAATGGNIALLLASQRPDLVRAVAVVDPGLSLDPSINSRVQEEIERDYRHDTWEQARASMPFSDLWTPAVLEHFAAHSWRQDEDGRWHGAYAKHAAQATEAALEDELWHQISLSCPLLAVRGSRSAVFDRPRMMRLAEAVQDSVIAEVPRADHRVAQDNPVALAAILDAFIRAVDEP